MSDPYSAPQSTTVAAYPQSAYVEPNWKQLLFSFEGRLNRGRYWKALLILIAVSIVAAGIGLALMFGYISEASSQSAATQDLALDEGPPASFFVGLAIVIIANLALIWPNLAVTAKRFHDRGKSGLWVLIAFIPYIGGLWILVECGFLEGTKGPNQYGPDPVPQS